MLGIHLLSITASKASHSSHALQAATCQNMQYLTHSLGGMGVEARGGERRGGGGKQQSEGFDRYQVPLANTSCAP
jgi:hypothetical protein